MSASSVKRKENPDLLSFTFRSLNLFLYFLYDKTQSENYIEFIHTSPIDALSLHIIYKIITTEENENMISIKKEHNVIEFMIHRFSMIDFYDTNLSEPYDTSTFLRAQNPISLRCVLSAP